MRGPRDVDWNDLRYFVEAARSGTLAGAARSLGVEHSTVGRRLVELERAMGASLMIRRRDGLKPTPLGNEITPLVAEMERIVLAIRELATSLRIRVRLAAPSGFSLLVSSQLTRLLHDHPGISLEILSGSVPVDLRKGEADLAVRLGAIADDDLVMRKLGQAGWSLYASDAYLARRQPPADPRGLAGHEIIGYDSSLAAMPGARWIDDHGTGAVIVMRTREMTEMLAAAVAGVGLAILPCMVAGNEPGLRRLTDEVLGSRAVSLVYRREALRSDAVGAVARFVIRVMRDHADLVSGAPGAAALSSPDQEALTETAQPTVSASRRSRRQSAARSTERLEL